MFKHQLIVSNRFQLFSLPFHKWLIYPIQTLSTNKLHMYNKWYRLLFYLYEFYLSSRSIQQRHSKMDQKKLRIYFEVLCPQPTIQFDQSNSSTYSCASAQQFSKPNREETCTILLVVSQVTTLSSIYGNSIKRKSNLEKYK